MKSGKKEYVYFAKIGKLCKIGFTKDLKTRVKFLKVGNPELELLGVICCEDAQELEKGLHKHFTNLWYIGEFFILNRQLDSFIRLHVRKSKNNRWNGYRVDYLNRFNIASDHPEAWIYEED